eukprot:scaffold270_cov121-Isochrysis_galbana.AAC.9
MRVIDHSLVSIGRYVWYLGQLPPRHLNSHPRPIPTIRAHPADRVAAEHPVTAAPAPAAPLSQQGPASSRGRVPTLPCRPHLPTPRTPPVRIGVPWPRTAARRGPPLPPPGRPSPP